MTHYVFSTHTNPQRYVEYYPHDGTKNHSVIKKGFVIMGGHGMCDKHFITPEGVMTTVEKDEDMEWLLSLESFKKDVAKGFIRYTKKREDSSKVIKRDMNLKDGSAPKTPKDMESVEGSKNTYRDRTFSGGNIIL